MTFVRRAGKRSASLLALALLSACAGNGGGGGSGGGGKPACTPPATPTVSFSSNVQPMFNRSCATSGCHDSSRAGGLDLSTGVAYGATVGKAALGKPGVQLIRAGNPDSSYIVQKIENTPGITGQQMPLGCPAQPQGGAVCVSADDLAALRTWVTECARKN